MKTLRSRLRRHLSYANVMASIAVFVAFGGISYAAATINGNKIVNATVAGKKLKNGTLTDKQVKKDSLTGNSIDESSLGTVPSAQTAASATTAATATTATTAGNANTANTATTANHALSADTATSATSADSALTAEEADTLDGLTSKELQVTCTGETQLFGGMCWDLNVRPAKNWISASANCGNAGGRLPSLSELIAYLLQPDPQVTGQNWSGDLIDVEAGGKEIVATSDEVSTDKSPSLTASLGYRCLFYQVN
jgi:hypothetical protein